MMIVILAHGEA